MKRIFKYTSQDGEYIHVPEGAELLKIAYQHGKLTAWCRIDESVMLTVPWRFTTLPTGASLYEANIFGEYVDTLFDGSLVWHIHLNKEG
jgi:hypothetical protein